MVLVNSGCSVYKQPINLQKNKAATIIPPTKQWGNVVYIDNVDGAFPNVTSAMLLSLYTKPLIVTEGKHIFRIGVQIGISGGTQELWLVAEGGKAYNIRTKTSNYKFRAWFEDAETNEMVGGLVGSSDEPL